jgi:O-antigen/teichoic acid export membrane protein
MGATSATASSIAGFPNEFSAEMRVARSSRISEFARHATVFTGANFVCLALNGVLAFLFPRLLSMEAYGYYRLFLLYGSFAGIVHLGFLDGLLIRWAEDPGARLPRELGPAFRFLGLEHAALLLPAVCVVVVFVTGPHSTVLAFAIAVYAWLWNWACLGQFALQALKLFSPLSLFTVAAPLLLLVAVLSLGHMGWLSLESVLVACLLANLIATVWQWVSVRRHVRKYSECKIVELGVQHLRLGWSVLGANLIALLVVSLDRIVLSARFSIRQFALYSFAANALALTYSAILSVARVVFPYLSDGMSPEGLIRAYQTGEAAVLFLWGIGICSYFPLAWMVGRWLPNYVESLPLIRVLMLATGLAAGIHIVHSSYFRISRQQNSFLIGAIIGLVSGVGLLSIAVHGGRLIYFAWAMAGSALAWWLFNELLLARMVAQPRGTIVRRLSAMGACAGVFLFCASRASLVIGMAMYAGWLVIFGIALHRDVEALPWSRLRFSPPNWLKDVFAD